MEYCVIFKCNGSTYKDRFKSIKVVNCPSLFLQHMACCSFDQFCQGVVDTTFATPIPDTHLELLSENVSQNSGIMLFRHPVNNRIARVSYTCKEVLLDRESEEILVLVWYANVRWSDEDWSQLGILNCKIRLNTIEFREIVADGQPCVAVPLRHVNLSAMRDEIKARCVLGKNVCYKLSNSSNRTQRSILIPAGMMRTEQIEHSGNWAIAVNGIITEVSPQASVWLEFDQSFENPIGAQLEDVMPTYHTAKDLHRITRMLRRLEHEHENSWASVDVEFCLGKGREQVHVEALKVSQNVVLFLFEPTSEESFLENRAQQDRDGSNHGGSVFADICNTQP